MNPFWEETYKDLDITTFGTKPNPTVKEFQHLFEPSWEILDIGCGEGQNCIYLAEQGFQNIDAFDLSENAVKKLRYIAKAKKVSINAWAEDLTKFHFGKEYHVIMSFGTLHFTEKEDWKRLLLDAQKNTPVGGIHIIQLFTNSVPASKDIAEFAVGLADESELKTLYNGWEILSWVSRIFEDEHPGVPKHLHASNKIAARRI